MPAWRGGRLGVPHQSAAIHVLRVPFQQGLCSLAGHLLQGLLGWNNDKSMLRPVQMLPQSVSATLFFSHCIVPAHITGTKKNVSKSKWRAIIVNNIPSVDVFQV